MRTIYPISNRQAGVTLVELMTVVVILGILASIAVPTYRSYLQRTNRSDAKAALMQLQTAQEKFYLQNNTYTDKVAANPPDGLGLSSSTAHGYYDITVPTLGADGQSYTAQATPASSGGQSDDKCGSFTITDTGVRDVVDGTSDGDTCWR